MTNPDNVGGLLPCPFCGAEPKLAKCVGYDQGQSSISCANCDVYMMDIHSHVIETWNRRELCRAAPAGGDDWNAAIEAAAKEADHWQSRSGSSHACGQYIAGAIRGLKRDSAPAGSGEVEALCQWFWDNAMVTGDVTGSPDDYREHAIKLLAFLRKLQQGADGVVGYVSADGNAVWLTDGSFSLKPAAGTNLYTHPQDASAEAVMEIIEKSGQKYLCLSEGKSKVLLDCPVGTRFYAYPPKEKE